MVDQEELERRKALALKRIHAAYGKDGHEYDVTMFVDHHLEEIEPEYWLKHAGVQKPDPADVLGLLILRYHWTPYDGDDPDIEDDEEGLQLLDFTLPENTTQYLICVEFDNDGQIDGIRMES